MSSVKAGDTKREEFRKYLERGGVLDALTKVLVGLYEEPEKPNDALDFVRQHLGSVGSQGTDVESLKGELEELRRRCDSLELENRELNAKVQELGLGRGPSDPAAAE